jgi:hypothetical protein
MYAGKKNEGDVASLVEGSNVVPLPTGVSFHQHFVVYWLEGDRILDLKLTTMVSRQVKLAISEAESGAGRKVKPDKVSLFSLCDGGAFWGFSVAKFRKSEKEGGDYRSGEMFLLPVFTCGVVKTQGEGANPELWEKCRAMQEEIRANYAAEANRRKRFAGGLETMPETLIAQPPHGDNIFPTQEPAFVEFTENPGAGEDLPF